MMKYGWLLLSIWVISITCNGHNEENAQSPGNSTDSLQYYPVQTYFRLQVNQADSNGHTKWISIQTENSKTTDTLSHESFYEIANAFSSIDVLESNLRSYYTESVFMDLTTNSYTFSYTTNTDSLPVKSIMVLVDTASSLVKRVFIRKQWSNTDSSVLEQMGWLHDSSFYINQSVSFPDKRNKQKSTVVTF